MSGSSPELEAALDALRSFVAELVDAELERRLDELAGPEWLTLEQAADRYHATPAALRKRAQRGQLPGAVRDGAQWLVDRRKLDAALAAATVAGDKRAGTARTAPPRHRRRSSHAR